MGGLWNEKRKLDGEFSAGRFDIAVKPISLDDPERWLVVLSPDQLIRAAVCVAQDFPQTLLAKSTEMDQCSSLLMRQRMETTDAERALSGPSMMCSPRTARRWW
jgi:hypothetical protein